MSSERDILTDPSVQAGKLYLLPPYLAFASLDRKSVRFTIPLCTVRRVERLNARAGIYALSLSLWHGMKIVSNLSLMHACVKQMLKARERADEDRSCN